MNWAEAQQLHSLAAADAASAAGQVAADRWLVARADGKWSPAEIVEHLTLAYEVLLRELGGGPGMQIRTKLWQRLMLRLTMLPKLMRGAPFPTGVRSPRETRPAITSTDQAEAIARLRDRAAKFDAAATESWRANPSSRLTHAYFGKSTVDNAMVLCARHLQHHQKQIVECTSPR